MNTANTDNTALETSNPTTDKLDVDQLLTISIIELLVSPEFDYSWIGDLAKELDSPVLEHEQEYLYQNVQTTLDQLAIPFIESLPESRRDEYRELMLKKNEQRNSA